MTRKTPIRHKVRTHKRQGKRIRSFERGGGQKSQRLRKSRVVGLDVNGNNYDVPISLERTPEQLERHLRSDGIYSEVTITEVDPKIVDPSEWTRFGPDIEKAREIAKSEKFLPRVVLVEKGQRYEVIDGIHRIEAMKIRGEKVRAIIIPRAAYEERLMMNSVGLAIPTCRTGHIGR